MVEKAGVGQTADSVWRELDKERGQILPQPPAPPAKEEFGSLLDLPEFVAAYPPSDRDGIHLVEPVKTEHKDAPWSATKAVPVQLSLFG